MLPWMSLWDGQSNDGKAYRHPASGTKSVAPATPARPRGIPACRSGDHHIKAPLDDNERPRE
jgi:hypothetical protein